ncbi:MAG: hypothetical protein KGL93_13260 [Gemmatimonadota bacterium]|nr:hypothetical protein [Gemmatimonadota bacterium]HEU4990296.1 hypothetical protein [Gemmatimonadaceae bacterium]
MTGYNLALFVHLLALLAATAASALVHFAAHRRAEAPTLRESMQWAGLIGKTSKVFPIAVLTLVLTGSYMVHAHWTWQVGWVEAGLLGAIALLATGAVLGARGGAQAQRNVARMKAAAGRELPNDAAVDRVSAVLSDMNTWLAISIVLVMTVKLALGGSLALMAAGAFLGAMRGMRRAGAAVSESDAEAEAA